MNGAAPQLRSAVDIFLSERIAGWAWDPRQPARSLSLDLEVNGTVVAAFPSDRLRTDLREQEIGRGECGFDFNPRPHLATGTNHCRLLVGGTGAPLPGGEHAIAIPPALPDFEAPILWPDRVWSRRSDPACFRPGDRAPPTHAQIIGLFNGGTSYAHELAANNGVMMTSHATEMLLFKHYPLAVLDALARATAPGLHRRALFVVMTRNPYDWIASMRRMPYGASFGGIDGPFSIDLETANHDVATYAAHIGGYLGGTEWQRHFRARNIVEFWNTYHADAIGLGRSDLAHVALLRYEDAVLHPCETLLLLQNLLTQPMRPSVTIRLGSAKPGHASSGTYLDASRKAMGRGTASGLGPAEIRLVSQHLRADVCDRLGYRLL